MLSVGDQAPDFSASDQSGRQMRLSDYRGRTTVIWFFSRTDTPG